MRTVESDARVTSSGSCISSVLSRVDGPGSVALVLAPDREAVRDRLRSANSFMLVFAKLYCLPGIDADCVGAQDFALRPDTQQE